MENNRNRILIFVVAYNAERTIENVVRRIISTIAEYETEVLIIDDSSIDRTFGKISDLRNKERTSLPLTMLYNPQPQGYGGNQKIGFHYAIQNKFDVIALVHGNGQYAPECLPDLLRPILIGEADAVFGSRMMRGFDAIRDGMPLYKYVGNRVLTAIQNRVLHSSLTEFHCGYRLYSVKALSRLPFDRNTDDFHFDTEIIIQLLRAGLRIKELPIPTYYGDEIRYVKGVKYAFQALGSSLLSRAQDYGILYQRKFDVTQPWENNPLYRPKSTFESPHTLALERVRAGSKVADIGCASGYVSHALKQRGCRVTGVDQFQIAHKADLEEFIQCDLDQGDFPVDAGIFDYILLLDVLEHLRSPERLLDSVRRSRATGSDLKVIFSTGNVAFLITRVALLFGWFNYGVRGILDLTHTRLFTFSTAQRLFEQSGYRIEEIRGIPAPFPLVVGDNFLGRFLLAVNKLLIRISKRLFAYQIFMVCSPLPTLQWLLEKAHEASREKLRAEACATTVSPGEPVE
jgi:glycosyltransferase involved in cell wall biosynthesis